MRSRSGPGRGVVAWLGVLGLATGVGLATLAVSTARASVAEALPLSRLVERATLVVLGQAVREDVGRDARGLIVTDVTVEVEDALKGEVVAGERILVRTFGGVIDGVGMRMPGAARIPVGGRYLLFVAERQDDPWLRPVGMSQGVMRLRASAGGPDEVMPGGADLHLVEPGSGGARPAVPALRSPTPWPEVRDALRSLVEDAR